MSIKERLRQEIDTAPDFLLTEVLEFFLFLKVRLVQRDDRAASSMSTGGTMPLFLQVAQEINDELAADDVASLPSDFSRNLDHYLYGFPKAES
jgi:hypothetical protein